MAPETKLRQVSLGRVNTAVHTYGRHKALAADLDMTDVELSRLLNDQLPRVCTLLELLGLEVVQAGHVADLRKVLKECL